MSLLRSPRLRGIRSRFESIRRRWSGKSRRGAKQLKPRRLALDPLEERQLLSVVPADWQDVLVNQTPSSAEQRTIAGQSIAVDNDGDFVVAWTRYDPVLQSDPAHPGQMIPVIDPVTGNELLDANIYARYFTDEVQRITVPDSVAVDSNANGVAGSFWLTYGGNEVQKITISATYQPATTFVNPYIAGAVTLGFDVNGNGIVAPGETTTVFFDEASEDFTEIASHFQTALQGLGGALTDVKVTGINPHEYTVEFGDLSLGQNQPKISVESVAFTSGFYPAVLTSTIREPVEIGPMYFSPTDPYQTANSIQQKFLATSTNFLMGPIEFAPPRRETIPQGPYNDVQGPRYTPEVLRTAVPGVTVTPVWELDPSDNIVKPSLTKFDVTFDGGQGVKEGTSGKKDHPLLVISQIKNDAGTSIIGDLDPEPVVTLKEPSPEFRVNPPEPDNPFTDLPDRYGQRRPDVAMDADGDFVITWEGQVPDVVQFGTVSDVFARRFEPVGIVDPGDVQLYVDMDNDGVEETPIQGVRAVICDTNGDGRVVDQATSITENGKVYPSDWVDVNGNGLRGDSPAETTPAFRVNTTTTGAQGQPAIGLDDEGNFVIAWGSGTQGFTMLTPPTFQGQELGYFNGIRARRFDRYGVADGVDFLVNAEITSIHYDPYVALSHDGYSAISWSTTDDEMYVEAGPLVVSSVEAKVFDPDGAVVRNQFGVGGGGGSSIAFDGNDNFVVTYDAYIDTNDSTGRTSEGVRAIMYPLVGLPIRDTFRPNSASFDPTNEQPLWAGWQGESQGALDEDGELVISYYGWGPDVSEDALLYYDTRFQQALIDLFYLPENADLLQYYDPAFDGFPLFDQSYVDAGGNPISFGTTVEIDKDIEDILVRALTRTSPPATSVQIGRIRALIDQVVGLLRGESNGVMYSRFDADPLLGPLNILSSDSIANSERDGWNTRYIHTIPTTSTGGTYDVRVTTPFGSSTVTINPIYVSNTLQVGRTANEIEAKLEDACASTGVHWQPHPQNTDFPYEGPVEVRVVSFGFGSIASEDSVRDGTPWEYTVLPTECAYEIVFQGEVRATFVYATTTANNLSPQGTPAPRWIPYQYGDEGVEQSQPSIGMEQDGDYVMAWTQYEEFTSGAVSNENIYYRRFAETTDTAGARVTDLIDQQNQGVANGGRISGPLRYVVLPFDEALKMGVQSDPNSAINPSNYTVLTTGGAQPIPIPEAVVKVEFGMNKAADLAGQPDGLGGTYPSTWTTSNRWEAVLVIDGNGILVPGGEDGLKTGDYQIEASTNLRDRAGNPLGYSGFAPGGQTSVRTFTVTMENPDVAVGGDVVVVGAQYIYGTTQPETPGAVAVDSDGHHVVVWTAFDETAGHNRVYMRLFDADGTPADLVKLNSSNQPIVLPSGEYDMLVDAAPVLPVTPYDFDAVQPAIAAKYADFEFDVQDHPNVAVDADGDIVVTWTNYADGDLDNPEIFARRFDSVGDLLGIKTIKILGVNIQVPWYKTSAHEAFQVNTYTPGAQKWSDVAMDLEGDFVITWTSYGQEAAEGALGTGYGIYARRYDAFGQPLAPEFRVNVTTGGNQQASSVAMAGDGDFVIVWTSDQNGIGDDIVAREFNADGSPVASPSTGEIVVNDYRAGDQRFPDVAMNLDGETYVVSWTATASPLDTTGTSVWAELSRPLPKRYVDVEGHAINATHRFTINVTDPNVLISDVNVQLGTLTHQRLQDLRFTLESPSGTQVLLFEDLPRPYIDGTRQPESDPDMVRTIFDDEAVTGVSILDADGGAVRPYTNSFIPQQPLSAFDGEDAQGTWTLIVEDTQPLNNLVGSLGAILPEIGSWSIIIDNANATANSFLVNTTRLSNQTFSSVGMDNAGGFVVSWSGNGDLQYQEDDSGVFYQRFSDLGTRIGLERRANSPVNIAGTQQISSVGEDASGNFVVAWTGPESDPATGNLVIDPSTGQPFTDVFKFTSLKDAPALDDDGPLVTDVLWNGSHVFDGDVLDSTLAPITQLTVVFSEDMWAEDDINDPSYLRSIVNPDNWVIVRNGSQIAGGVSNVDFGYNPLTRKYEAVVSLDGNGISVGTPGLPSGQYMLVIKDDVTDVSIFYSIDPLTGQPVRSEGNRLDGDADGVPSSSPISLGYGGFVQNFVVGGGPNAGPEFRINPTATVSYEQRFSAAFGTGLGREESTKSVAVDHDGDFVAVWTSYGQTPGDPVGGDIYFRLYDRNNNPIIDTGTGLPMTEKRVNTFTTGMQRNAAVAMDAVGEFVVVWESEDQDPDGSWGVYGQRFSSIGEPLGSEFRVNTDFTRNQVNPDVAMDNYGNYVVVWATAGQDFSFFNDVYGQRYNKYGERLGLQFLVNTFDLPGVNPPPGGSFEINPAVAMSGPLGSFVAAWDVVTAQQNGVVTDSVIGTRMFAADGTALGAEFQGDTGPGAGGGDIQRVSRNPQLTMDDQGGFILVWESYMGLGVAYDVFFAQYSAAGGLGANGQVNMTQFGDDQVNPSVAIDADGDFAIVWNGFGAQPDPLNPANADLWTDDDSEGVFIRRYDADSTPVEVQSRVNRTESGIQQFPTIAMEPDGDAIVVWNGRGVGDIHGIFARRYDVPVDTAGPLLTELRLPDNTLVDNDPSRPPISSPNKLVVVFDEQMWMHKDASGNPSTLPWQPGDDPDSVENPSNWTLTRNGLEVEGVIQSIDFKFNAGWNKWIAEITFAGSLPAGNYTLTARNPVPDVPDTQQIEGHPGLRDAVGNPLAQTGFLPGGENISLSFAVGRAGTDFSITEAPTAPDQGTTYPETRGAVAADADGDSVAVFSTPGVGGNDEVWVRLFDADGAAAATRPDAFWILDGDSHAADFAGYGQKYATVAADADGDFVVSWTQYDEVTVLIQQPSGPAVRVPLHLSSVTGKPTLDPTAGPVMTEANVYYRRFTADGSPLGDAARANVYGYFDPNRYLFTDAADFAARFSATSLQTRRDLSDQQWSDVAVDVAGDFVVTWSSYSQEDGGQLGSGWGIYARRYDSFGQSLGGEFQVNVTTAGNQKTPAVAMSDLGSFVIVWTSDQNAVGMDIVGRVYDENGVPIIGPLSGEILINDTTAGNQQWPDVGITPSGNNFVVTWTSSGQDGSGEGIFAQLIDVTLLQQGQAAPTMTYTATDVPQPIGFADPRTGLPLIGNSVITVPDNFPDAFAIADVDVQLTINHANAREVEVHLISPAGTNILLFRGVPRNTAPASNFTNTLINDEATIDITDPTPGVVVSPFLNLTGYVPEELLSTFDGQNSNGTWRLIVQDTVRNSPPGTFPTQEVNGVLVDWSLILTRVPAKSGEIQLSTTTTGNQMFSSVAMDRQGEFTIAWCGNGTQRFQEDDYGIFYQQFAFNGEPIGSETRANVQTDGVQRTPSIASDATGNFVVTWTGESLGASDVYRFLSTDYTPVRDVDGPIVTDVYDTPGGNRLVQGALLDAAQNITELTVAFSENLSVRGGDTGLDSVLNPQNWVLERDGVEIPGAVTKVAFDLNPLTRKYEAVLSLDGNGFGSGITSLPIGDYTLTVRDSINDRYTWDPVVEANTYFLGNALDGDFDGSPGTSASATGYSGYKFQFSVASFGAAFRINMDDPATAANELLSDQRFSAAYGTGYAREQSTRSVAVDDDGDFVVVWTSYGQDDPSDPNGAGVYMRMFDRNNEPLTDAMLVNTVTQGHQRDPSVAMDIDGEFVVVWEAENDNVDGSWGVYGRRFSSIGEPLGGQFRVNTTVQNDQLNPSVGMDDFGNFVVVWATKGQAFSYFNDVRGQLYNYRGERIGSEFLVNQVNIPGVASGPGSIQLNPAVAMDDDGNFVVAWDEITAQLNGVITDSQIVARLFDNTGTAVGPEFVADSGVGTGGADIQRVARNPQVAMDDRGGFIVVWESYLGNVTDAYDVFFQQFDATGAALTSGQVNEVPQAQTVPPIPDLIFDGNQVNASVAIDADGDFAVVWNGKGAQPDPLNPTDLTLVGDRDTEGVFLRKYDAATELVSVESRVNRWDSGIQQFPSIGMEPDGDMIVVWNGMGVGDLNGIYARRYDELTDTAGPKVSDLLRVVGSSGQRDRIEFGAQLTQELSQLVVVFDENMKSGNPQLVTDSVRNPQNYTLLKDGVQLVGGIQSIDFALNPATNKWEAVLNLDGNGARPGVEPLGDGHYELVVSNKLRDVVGNPLGRTGWNLAGQDFVGQFDIVVLVGKEMIVNDITNGDQITRIAVPDGVEHSPQAVAGDADGEYVAVWTDTTAGQQGVWARLYNGLRWSDTPAGRVSTGPTPGASFRVTSNPTATFASVARDADGDFVVTWSQNDGTDLAPDWNVWARRYDAMGRPFGNAFEVNSVTEGTQRYSTVAMDVDGDFVITWQSDDQLPDLQGRARDGDGYGVYAQRYNPAGQPLGGANEVQVLTFVNAPVGTFKLEWDGDNNPATPNVTGLISIKGNPYAIVDQVETELNALAGDVNRVEVQAISLTEIIINFVQEGAAKDQDQIVVSTTAFADPTSAVLADTLIEGYRGEFLVNDTTANNQMFPSVAMSAEGTFVITWTSAGQDGDASHETNIYAKKFLSNDAFRYPADNAGARDYDYGARIQYPDAYFAVSTDDPDNHIVDPGAGYDGVVQLYDPLVGAYGTGSLLWTGRHILTAAHVVDIGGGVPTPMIVVYFDTPNGPVTMTATNIIIHPGWNGDLFNANDLAIIVLPEDAPAEAERYGIYRGSDELNRVVDMVGYGVAGQGAEQFFDFRKRIEWNEYEAYGDDLNGISMVDFFAGLGAFDIPAGKILVYDFDSGLPANDALGKVLGIGNLGLGEEEGASSHGDSGGPSFINGLIAGVVSGGAEYAPADSDLIPFNVSFGTVEFHTRVSAYADWIDMIAQSTSPEFLVNDVPLDPVTGLPLPTGNQKWSSVAMDADGDFAITWTSYGQDGSPNPYGAGYLGEEGVLAKRYNSDTGEFVDPATGLPLGEFLVNTSTDGKQQHPQMQMDADGDFIIAWESSQDRPGGAGDVTANYGVFAQRYASNARVGVEMFLGPNGEIGGELEVNRTKTGDQRFPSVAMDDTGDAVVLWAGNGALPYVDVPDTQGIFHQRFESLEDDAGPMVADVINVVQVGSDVVLQQLPDGITLDAGPTQVIVSFSEDLIHSSPSLITSITNLNNWILTRNGQVVPRGVAAVSFGLNQSASILSANTNKYEAVIKLDGDPNEAGDQPLGPGTYVLRIRSFVEDQFNNRLDGDYDGQPDGDFRRTFTVAQGAGGPPLGDETSGIGTPAADAQDKLVPFSNLGNQDSPAVAADAEGNYVVAWVETADVLDPTGAVIGQDSNIKARRFDPYGNPIGGEFVVNSYRTGDQFDPDVAMDDYGNFVVTWSGQGEVDDQGTVELVGIFARVFDAFGQPLGGQFHVNQSGAARKYPQTSPSVAMDANGEFAITWTSYGQDGDLDGVFARRYNFLGEAQGNEFLVNTTTANQQANSDIAMDAGGNSVIVWSSYRQTQDGSEWGVFGQRYNAAGARLGGEFRVNTYTADDQNDAHVAMDAAGNFVVTWASMMQDLSEWGVYARRFNAAGTALDANGFRVNVTTLSWQYQPDVAMDADGTFVVTWTSVGQDNPDFADKGIFARVYNASGTDFIDPATGTALREFRVNANVIGDQTDSAVAMDADGDMTVVWVGPDADRNGVYQRHMQINAVSASGGGTSLGAIPSGGVYFAGGSSSSTSSVLALAGTSGNDVFEFIAGPTAATSTVRINGVAKVIDPAVTQIRFDGLAGTDKVIFTGSPSNETVDMWPDHGKLTASRYTVTVSNVEKMTASGGGGDDLAVLRDSPNTVDTATLKPNYGRIVGTGFDVEVSGFRYVHALATQGGGDVLLTYDDPHTNDVLDVAQTATIFSGPGFYSRGVNFANVYGYATPGGNDAAVFHDDPGAVDTFRGWSTEATFTNSHFFSRVKSFAAVYAFGTDGTGDVAMLYDRPGAKDTFDFAPVDAKMYGDGYSNRVRSFDSVFAYATAGSGDVAVLHDDPSAKDALLAWPDQARLSGTGFQAQANSFDFVVALGTKGNGDVATLYGDPAAADRLDAWSDKARLYGAGFSSEVRSFDSVVAVGTEGNRDVAALYDNPGAKDTFNAWPDKAKLSGAGYSNQANSFDFVVAVATEGDGDVAAFYDDPAAKDSFRAWPDKAKLYGAGYSNQANSFDFVVAVGTEGNGDVAALYDNPAAVDTFNAWPDEAKLFGPGYSNRVKSFDIVVAVGTEGSADKAVLYDDPAAKDTFKAWPNLAKLYGAGYFNQVNSFDSVVAVATEGNGDAATLYDDPAAKDTFKAWPDQAKLTGAGFSNQAVSFDVVAAVATKGSGDVATLYDNPTQKDVLRAWPGVARFYGNGFSNYAYSFDSVVGIATEGNNDAAVLFDDPVTTDTFEARPTQAKLFGDNFSNQALSFRQVYAYATEGGRDVAKLYDDPTGTDTLTAWPTESRLEGDGFSNRALSFRYVRAYATPGGNDLARMYDSAGKDTFEAGPGYAKLYDDTYDNQAYSFRNVYAISSKGDYDYAYLYDSALEEYPDHLSADANWARLSNDLLGYFYWVGDFEEVSASSSNNSDTSDVDPNALDFILNLSGNW